jgi:hypothetical protein
MICPAYGSFLSSPSLLFPWTFFVFGDILIESEVILMVKLLDPHGSTEARGSSGGRTYNTWRGINYAKTKTSPAQPRTAKQLVIRAYAMTLVRKWQTLTTTKQGWWNDYAAAHPDFGFGGTQKRLTGANWYVRLNTRLAQISTAAVDTPPSIPAPNAVVGLVATGAILSISCDWTQETAQGTQIDFWTDGPHSPGRLGKIERAKHRGWEGGNAVGPKVLSNLAPGRYTVFARLMNDVDGNVGVWTSSICTVTAT